MKGGLGAIFSFSFSCFFFVCLSCLALPWAELGWLWMGFELLT